MNIVTKNGLLITGSIIAFVLCYQLAFSETFYYKSQYDQLKREQALFKDLPNKKALLYAKNKRYDSLIKFYQIANTSLQNNLLRTIDTYTKSNHIDLIDFQEPHVLTNGDLSTTNYIFTVSGDFRSLLALAYHLEQQANLGSIASLDFRNVRDFKYKKTRLEARFILEVVQ